MPTTMARSETDLPKAGFLSVVRAPLVQWEDSSFPSYRPGFNSRTAHSLPAVGRAPAVVSFAASAAAKPPAAGGTVGSAVLTRLPDRLILVQFLGLGTAGLVTAPGTARSRLVES